MKTLHGRVARGNVSVATYTTSIGIVACTLIAGACHKEATPPAAPPPEVYVAPVIQRDVPVYLELAGQTEGFQDVEIRARVEGWLQTVSFREGSFVRKGQLLYQIDPKPFETSLAAANGDFATGRARPEKSKKHFQR